MAEARAVGRGKLTVISGIVWFVSWGIARAGLEYNDLSDSIRVLLALLPVIPFAWFLWNFVKGAAELDELQRRIQLEALAIAYPVMMVFLMTVGLLDIAVGLNPENFGAKHLWYYVVIFYLAGVAIATRRYR